MFANIILRFLGKNKTHAEKFHKTPVVKNGPSSKKRKGKASPSEIDLSNLPYISLPPSPSSWESKKNERIYYKECENNPKLKEIVDWYYQGRTKNIVKSIPGLDCEIIEGNLSALFIDSYRKEILSWARQKKYNAAAKLSTEMFHLLSGSLNNTDIRRHNKYVKKLNVMGKVHNYIVIELRDEIEEPLFEINDSSEWEIESVSKFQPGQKPDTAFRKRYPCMNGMVLLDDLGKSARYEGFTAAMQKLSRDGAVLKEKGINHDIHNVHMNYNSEYLSILTSDAMFYVYNGELDQQYCIDFVELAEVNNYYSRNPDTWGETRNHIRTFDVSIDGEKIFFTIGDEAYVYESDKAANWSIKMPPKAGWERIVEKVNITADKEGVDEAMSFMGLTFPTEYNVIKQRYHQLALKYHPDLNKDENATDLMKTLNNSYEILTGLSAEEMLNQISEISHYRQPLDSMKFEVDGHEFELSVSMGGSWGQDWIYASSFGPDNSLYLGTYSGRIIEIDGLGCPIRVFDVGSVPEKIVRIEDYLYILTHTRLYILKNNSLLQIADVFEMGDLIITNTGFGLLSDKRFKWFNSEGHYKGEIISKNPIRNIYQGKKGLIVESRQHRAIIPEFPELWN